MSHAIENTVIDRWSVGPAIEVTKDRSHHSAYIRVGNNGGRWMTEDEVTKLRDVLTALLVGWDRT